MASSFGAPRRIKLDEGARSRVNRALFQFRHELRAESWHNQRRQHNKNNRRANNHAAMLQ